MKVIDNINILAIGRNAAIMAVVERLLNSHEHWIGKAVISNAAAIEAIEKQPYEIVLLCGGITPTEESALRTQLQQQQPDVIIAQHYGGGSGLLENEILGLMTYHGIQFR